MATMNRQCQYSRIPYASFRLHTYRRLFLSTVEVPNTRASWRSFSSCESRPNQSSQSTKLPDQSGGTTDSSLYTPASALPHDRTFTSNTQSHNGHRDPSRLPDPTIALEKPTDAPARQCRASENLVKSPIQIRKAKRAVRDARREPPPPTIQKALKHNPWAEILATPARQCSVTGVRAPSDLLIDYGLIKHPDSLSLWAMPTKLLEDELKCSKEGGDVNASRGTESPPSLRIANCPDILGLHRLQRPSLVSRLFTHRLRRPGGNISQKDQRKMVWREDMTDFVLRSLRTYATKWLKKSSLNDGRTVTPRAWKVLNTGHNPTVQQLEDALKELGDLENMTWGAVLVLSPGSGRLVEAAENSNTETVQENSAVSDFEMARDTQSAGTTKRCLPDLIQLPNHACKVPIFDLRRLLSEANLDELRNSHPLFQQHSLFFRPFKNITEQPLVALWKVKLHMTDDDDFPS